MAKRIDQELKARIIEKLKSEGLSVRQASTEFGLSPNTIYGWLGHSAGGDPSALEIAKLRRENNELKQLVGGLTLNMERGKKNHSR